MWLEKKKKLESAQGVGQVVIALGREPGFAGSMRN